jgi:hypothetical protein
MLIDIAGIVLRPKPRFGTVMADAVIVTGPDAAHRCARDRFRPE